MNRQDALKLFEEVTTWKRGGVRAPNKPLLLLYAIGEVTRQKERLSYRDIDEPLSRLLLDFGPTRKSIHTEYPFWRLQNDGLWFLENHEGIETRTGNTDAKKTELVRLEVTGGFIPEIISYLSADDSFVRDACEIILKEHFPPSIHEDILESCGITFYSKEQNKKSKRDPNFRAKVLSAYRNRCAICGIGVQVNSSHIILEGAHIKWHQAGGPDEVDNGLALCVLHHKLFDRGAFTISSGGQLSASEQVSGQGVDEILVRYHDTEIRSPISSEYRPKAEFLDWHFREVFKKPFA
jgi:putative restriction endonuclease